MKWSKHIKGSDSPVPRPVTLRSIEISGNTTHVQGPVRCPICATSHMVAGRPGQHIRRYKYACRCCHTPVTVIDLTFGCSN